MWVKVDDGFPGHRKVSRATAHLGGGKVAKRRVLAVWLEAMCHVNQHLSDGFISKLDGKSLTSDTKPLDVLEVFCLEDVRLMHRVDGGFVFHKYEVYQPLAETVKERRARDLARKKGGRSTPDSARNPRLPVPVPDQDKKEQRASRAPIALAFRKTDDDEPNVAVLTALAHDVIQQAAGVDDVGDLIHQLKGRAAQLRMAYDGQSTRKAIESALAQRRRSS